MANAPARNPARVLAQAGFAIDDRLLQHVSYWRRSGIFSVRVTMPIDWSQASMELGLVDARDQVRYRRWSIPMSGDPWEAVREALSFLRVVAY